MNCPECGLDTGARCRPEYADARPRRKPARLPASRHSAVLTRLGLAAVAVVLVLAIVACGGGDADVGQSASPTAQPVAVDTSGTYAELVARANDLYDQGIMAFNANDPGTGVRFFQAAAEVYAAAWEKRSGDPNVGTDLAIALFYSGRHDEALRQVDAVLRENPRFQPGHLNKAVFLQNESGEAKDAGDDARAKRLLDEARETLEKAVSIDPASEVGRRAAELLRQL
jgi:tetratricopeptide (TPR) repeat protein